VDIEIFEWHFKDAFVF